MFCARCGQQIPEASEICPLCGREASVRLDPPPPAMAPAAAAAPGQIQWPDEAQPAMPPARRPDLRGVGGWLLFFCIALTMLAPLQTLIQVSGGGFEKESIADLIFAVFGVCVGIMVWIVHPRAFLLLWIYFGLTAAAIVLGIAGFVLSAEEQDPKTIVQLVRSLISSIIWFLYFKKSDRVQATFGRNL